MRFSAYTLMMVLVFAPLVGTVVRADDLPQFPGIQSVPISPKLNFGGFFKIHQPIKIVFGISEPGNQLQESLINAAATVRYLKSKHDDYVIQFVLYGKAVLTADEWEQKYSSYGPQFRSLHAQGVEFRVCHNSMYSLHVQAADLYPFMVVVPAGILQLTKKQLQGFSYISNH